MIEVTDLVKWHGPIEVLRGVSLAVSRGEVAAIIGPSGSGKSTFLRCLNGLESFQSGCVTLDGLRIDAWRGRPTGRDSIARSAAGSAWYFRASTSFRTGPRSRTSWKGRSMSWG